MQMDEMVATERASMIQVLQRPSSMKFKSNEIIKMLAKVEKKKAIE